MDEGSTKPRSKPHGLVEWMKQAQALHRSLRGGNLSADTVHDLRVSLRRCLSMMDVYKDLDGHPTWIRMHREARALFKKLGSLRDLHVMRGWLADLSPSPCDPSADAVSQSLDAREREDHHAILAQAHAFPVAEWSAAILFVPNRVKQLQPDGLVFQHAALEAFERARRCEWKARSKLRDKDYHALRIAIKRFRYILENFLPTIEKKWQRELKKIQTLLGEVHDFEVLEAKLDRTATEAPQENQVAWRRILDHEREWRLDEYRQMAAKEDLWIRWGTELPNGPRLDTAALASLAAFASFRSPDSPRAQQTARISIQIFDGLRAVGFDGPFTRRRARRILYGAALLHTLADIGPNKRGSHKRTYRLILDRRPPCGWTKRDRLLAALVARYHRGSLPSIEHRGYRKLEASERRLVWVLAAVLRQANSLTHEAGSEVTHVAVDRNPQGNLIIYVGGYDAKDGWETRVEKNKRHLERVCHATIEITPAAP